MKQALITFAAAALLAGCGDSETVSTETEKSVESHTENSVESQTVAPPQSVSAPAIGLEKAVHQGNAEAVRQHIAAGSDLNVRRADSGSTPLITGATFGQTETASLLIEAGADLNIRNNDGSTALHTAVFLCRTEIVKALLEKGADKNIRNSAGATALDSVAGPFEDVKPIYDLLARVLGPAGLKLDYVGIKSLRPQIAEMLREHISGSSSGNGRADRPSSPTINLFNAAATDNVDAVKQHIAAGSDLNLREPVGGSTSLTLACVFGRTDAAEALIDAGANLEIKNNEGTTPLYNAAFFCHPKIVKALLANGADVNTTNKDGGSLIEVMAADWNPSLERVYQAIFGALGLQRDLEDIKRIRPAVLKLLQEHTKKNAAGGSAPVSPQRPATEVAKVRGDLPPITAADWSSYNHDVRGWRFNSAEKTLSADNASKLKEKWRFPAKGSTEKVGVIHATPTVVNGYVYFGTATFPAFYKLKPDGTLAWVYRLKTGQSQSKPLPQGGVNTIDAENGIMTSALVTETSVFFGNSAGVFFALDRVTGEEFWKVDTRAVGFPNHHTINIFNASAILADGKVIVGGGGYEHPYPLNPKYPCCTGRGFVVAFDPANGKVVWKYEVGEKPEKFDEPVIFEDANGKHVFQYGPSTSSVWSTPSYDEASDTIFFGTDVHNSPRKPTDEDPKYHTKYSAAVIAVDVKTGLEKWVTQLNEGDIFNHTMSGYDPKTRRYKDCSVGDTPKVYSIKVDGQTTKVVGVGCKNGGFYVLGASDGKLIGITPVFEGKPQYPLDPQPDPRMIALPSVIGGIQTGCATDGKNIFTNGIDWLLLNTKKPGSPEGGRIVSVSGNLAQENWRHERPTIRSPLYTGGDPVAAGVALGNGIACFTPAITEQLVVLDAETGKTLKEIHIGTVWSGPSISRGRIYVGTGSILFLKKEITGTLYSFGLPGEDEIARMDKGNE